MSAEEADVLVQELGAVRRRETEIWDVLWREGIQVWATPEGFRWTRRERLTEVGTPEGGA